VGKYDQFELREHSAPADVRRSQKAKEGMSTCTGVGHIPSQRNTPRGKVFCNCSFHRAHVENGGGSNCRIKNRPEKDVWHRRRGSGRNARFVRRSRLGATKTSLGKDSFQIAGTEKRLQGEGVMERRLFRGFNRYLKEGNKKR